MTNEEASTVLKNSASTLKDGIKFLKEPHQNQFKEAYEMAIQALEQTQWIPVSERLPKAGEYVGDVAKYYLVQNEYGE